MLGRDPVSHLMLNTRSTTKGQNYQNEIQFIISLVYVSFTDIRCMSLCCNEIEEDFGKCKVDRTGEVEMGRHPGCKVKNA